MGGQADRPICVTRRDSVRVCGKAVGQSAAVYVVTWTRGGYPSCGLECESDRVLIVIGAAWSRSLAIYNCYVQSTGFKPIDMDRPGSSDII